MCGKTMSTEVIPQLQLPASEGLKFQLNADQQSYFVKRIGTCTDTVVVIPSTHEGLPVTGIGTYAFYQCTSITAVIIPNSVKSIGDYAFQDCIALLSIDIPSSVTSIGQYAFHGCKQLASVKISENISAIPNGAFGNCTSLTSVTIPSYVTSIGNFSFSGCTSLSTIEFKGTKEQWSAISLGTKWNLHAPCTEIDCIDGKVNIE
jgi:hypothetical protein